jgi:hypothetical protein
VFWAPAPAINVSVNQNTRYQTIEGFGPMENAGTWTYKSGPFYVSCNLDSIHYFDTLIIDGGFTALRADPVTAFQPTQGDFAVTGGVRQELIYESKYTQVAQRMGEPFRILWTAWSPPPWMKANNSSSQVGANDANNYLMPSHFTDYANHWIRLLQIARDTFGVNVYAISLQNEPLFNEPYPSCNYSLGSGCGWNGYCYNQMFHAVAPLIHAAFPNVKLVASEDLNRTTIETNLRGDAVSNPLVYAWATHNDYTGSFAYWPDRPIWQTEPHPVGFMDDAQMCMSNIESGAATWFDWGYSNGNCATAGTATTACLKANTYLSLKMYARYVRPGAQRILSSGGVSGSYGVIAFYHPTDTCLTIILVNGTGAAQPAVLSVTGTYQPATFHAFRSTTSEDETDLGTVPINGTISMAANSMTTLVAGRYHSNTGTPVARPTAASRPTAAAAAVPARLYSIDGRLAAQRATSARGQLAPGVYCAPAAAGQLTKRSLIVTGN